MDVQVRLLQEEDILALYKALYREEKAHLFWERCRQLLKRLEAGSTYPVIALCKGKVVGRAHLISYPHLVEVAEVMVVPAYRRQGIATLLIQTLLAIAQQKGATSVDIGTEEDNVPALTLYQKLGFREKSRREVPAPFPPYYQTAILLYKNLE